jgi:hypothetical protein
LWRGAGDSSLLAVHSALWIGLALLDARVLRMVAASAVEALGRGSFAAARSTGAYLALSPFAAAPGPGAGSYPFSFLLWMLVCLPGCIALFCGRTQSHLVDRS